METWLSFFVGLGLSAACGFRVFVPLLVMNLSAQTGFLELSSGFQWMGEDPALIAFSVATVLEVLGYTIPWVDNLLDAITTPAAVVAGTLTVASVVTGLDPFLRWSLAIIAGGGAAGAIQIGTVAARSVSSAVTGGLGNPTLSTAETGSSAATASLAVFVPLLAPLVVVFILVVAFRRLAFRRRLLRRTVPVRQQPTNVE